MAYNFEPPAILKDFMKADDGKVEYDLFPDDVLEDVVKVMMFGAKKYERDNWKKAKDSRRYYNALRRHLVSFRRGEYVDPDSNLPHLAHALCNLVFMHYLEEEKKKYGPKFDNSYTASSLNGTVTRTPA